MNQTQVGVDHQGIFDLRHLERDFGFLRLQLELLNHVVHEVGERKLLEIRRKTTGLEHCELE